MKVFLTFFLLVFSSISFAAYTPLVEVSLGYDKTIHVLIINDSGMDLKCKYSVSWFVNVFSYRNEFGQLLLKASEEAELVYRNDEYSHLTGINAKAICE